MKKNRILSAVIGSALALGVLAGCGNGGAGGTSAGTSAGTTTGTSAAGSGDKIVLRAGTATERDGSYVQGLEFFKEKVEEYSNGQIEVQIFPSSTLGNERDLIEGLSLGTVEMAVSSTAPLGNFSDEFKIFDMPYLFSDLEKGYEFMDGDHGKEILGSLDTIGIKALGFWENGFRNVTNNGDPILTPDQMAGVKIRVQENEIHQETFKLLGALPTPMAWGEVFTSLQQGTIDAQENPLVIIQTNKLWEAQDSMSLTEHFYSPAVLLMNKDLFDGMSAELQDAVIRAEAEARVFEREFNQEQGDAAIQAMKDNGMAVNEVDKEAWIEATRPIYDKYRDMLNPEYLSYFGY